MKNTRYTTKEWESKIINACKKAKSMAHACASIGLNHNTFITHAKRLGVYKPNPSGKGFTKNFEKYATPIEEIIYEGKHPQYNRSNLKKRLFKAGLKKRQCESCGEKKWLGEDIPLALHHKDGVSSNHLLENLQILCPNCHAFTDSYCGKNVNNGVRIKRLEIK
jgi:hypothetical protein